MNTSNNDSSVSDDDTSRTQGDSAAASVPARPIKCILNSSDDKGKLLRNAKKIRESNTTRFNKNKVFFVPDQTSLEREDDLELRDSLRKKRQAFPDKQFIIRRRKVVEKNGSNDVDPGSPRRGADRIFWNSSVSSPNRV